MDEQRPKRLLAQVRDAIRLKHYSYRTEQAYVGWIKRYIFFHHVRHPAEMGVAEAEAFLTHLAVKGGVAASTQNQALSALLFLYRDVLDQDLGPIDALRAKRPKRLPTILTQEETLRLIGCLSGTHQLMAKLLYGSGLRLMECLRLRVKDPLPARSQHPRSVLAKPSVAPARTNTRSYRTFDQLRQQAGFFARTAIG